MVLLLDLDEDCVDPSSRTSYIERHPDPYNDHGNPHSPVHSDAARPNPNFDSRFSASLSCYPVVLAIASHLDLNSLHDLSLCCRQFRANLLQYRSQLVKHTLRCTNEEQGYGEKLGDRFRDSQLAWIGANGRTMRGETHGRITSGRVGRCARDMVGECRRCGNVVCRNCTIKPPSNEALKGRHRRLCRPCLKAPLSDHTKPTLETRDEPFPSTPSPPSSSASSASEIHTDNSPHPAFARTPCTCPEMVYLCHSCGNSMRTSDTTYMRGWTWRTRYSTYLGGLGTGIGEGNEGVACGRESACLAAREVEKEIDCDAAELESLRVEMEKFDVDGPGNAEGRHSDWGGTSYAMQEIEGLGGVMKKKMKKLVRVGMVVREYEDERDSNEFLVREQKRLNRSWCAWCNRVVPNLKDEQDLEKPALI